MNHTVAVILAGGMGTRMKAPVPKVLLEIGGKPMIQYPLAALHKIGIDEIVVVVGCQGGKVIESLGNQVEYVWQPEQLGNAHALGCAREKYATRPEVATVISLQGDDSFLYGADLLAALIKSHGQNQATITALTIKNHPAIPRYFWRVGLRGRKVTRMIGSEEAQKLKSLAGSQALAGSYCFQNQWLWSNLELLLQKQKKPGQEYYLPDLIALALGQSGLVQAFPIDYGRDWLGVNTPAELSKAREIFTARKR